MSKRREDICSDCSRIIDKYKRIEKYTVSLMAAVLTSDTHRVIEADILKNNCFDLAHDVVARAEHHREKEIDRLKAKS